MKLLETICSIISDDVTELRSHATDISCEQSRQGHKDCSLMLSKNELFLNCYKYIVGWRQSSDHSFHTNKNISSTRSSEYKCSVCIIRKKPGSVL